VVERAHSEADGHSTRENGGGNVPTNAVGTNDQQRPHHQRGREANLMEHSTKQRPLQHSVILGQERTGPQATE
jgi:hypothetical protein